MEHKYRVSFRIGDASFDLESTDLTWLETKEKDYVAKLWEKAGHLIKSTQHNDHPKTAFLPQNLTINEFYKKYIKTNKITARPDIAVFFVYYLEKILKKEIIKTADVVQCFADVSYPNYSKFDIGDILNEAKRKALLNYVNNNWLLTITGEVYVLNNITGENQ
ncbi:MAG: hypothetical protein ACREOI_04875 [bacterium]